MTDSNTLKKVARKGESWQRNNNQRLKRVKMEVSRDKEVQSEWGEYRDKQFDRRRIKIDIESSEEMEINQDEGFLRGTSEIG